MLIEELVTGYRRIADDASSAVQKETVLARIADDVLEMVRSYAGDSRVFYEDGDLVNAFAATAYGYGWLDCGCYLGLTCGKHCDMPVLERDFPADLRDKLEEKTLRYQRMLTEALKTISVAPDAETVSASAARQIAVIATEYLKIGNEKLSDDYLNALSAFSYGYGWLDCGVRFGLFAISGNRHLFTI